MFNYKNTLSEFGNKFSIKSGILELMEDLGKTVQLDDILMLGGGNPAHIKEVEAIFIESLDNIIKDRKHISSLLGNYDEPRGNSFFIQSMAELLNEEYQLNISPKNIAVTTGSQNAFFILFNFFGGKHKNGALKKILLPYVPEYVGYSELGIDDNLFQSFIPEIEFKKDHFFKYKINFNEFNTDKESAAVCISRPANPSGNIITDEEINKIYTMTVKNNIPLIIDNAYGNPFPGIIFTQSSLTWQKGMILVLSLSKLGLPGTRTGLIIADEEVIEYISAANAIINLANNNIGQAIASNLIAQKKIMPLVKNIIQPFYLKKSIHAIQVVEKEMSGIDYKIHVNEGAFFLWIWFRNLPITSLELYSRLKKQNVIIVPGEFFFPGLNENWKHKSECIRLSFAKEAEIIEDGIKIIADTIKKLY